MARLPAFGRELLDMRRFGNRRPPLGVVFITDWWEAARVQREQLRYFTLVVEPFIEYGLDCCHALDVVVLMRGDRRLVMKALRRAKPARIHICTPAEYFDWLDWIITTRTARKAVA